MSDSWSAVELDGDSTNDAACRRNSSERGTRTPVVRVTGVGKAYRIWRRPSGRVLAPVAECFSSVVPQGHPWRSRLTSLTALQYTDFQALRDIDLTVARGECLGIMGRNGSGKSTLVQLIAGTLQPTSGSIVVEGRLGVLLELGSGFNLEFTGRENVFLNASILGLSRSEIEKRFEAIEKFADIGSFIDQPKKTYSSGMMVRLAFAVNSVVEPEILLIDEVLAVGDSFFQQKCYRLMRNDLKNCTKIIVSHDPHVLAAITQRAVVLDRGFLRFDGPVRDAIAFYAKLVQDEAFVSGIEREGREKPKRSLCFGRFDDLPWVKVAPARAYPTRVSGCGTATLR